MSTVINIALIAGVGFIIYSFTNTTAESVGKAAGDAAVGIAEGVVEGVGAGAAGTFANFAAGVGNAVLPTDYLDTHQPLTADTFLKVMTGRLDEIRYVPGPRDAAGALAAHQGVRREQEQFQAAVGLTKCEYQAMREYNEGELDIDPADLASHMRDDGRGASDGLGGHMCSYGHEADGLYEEHRRRIMAAAAMAGA